MKENLSNGFSRTLKESYQFIHVSTAATKRVKKETGRTFLRINGHTYREIGWSAQDLLNEALRVPGACPHVAHPEKPLIIYAASDAIRADPMGVVELAYAWADSRKAITGRKHQLNSPILACGVISLNRDRKDDWPEFHAKSLEFLKSKYGERLRLVVEHRDEGHFHSHYIAIPLFGLDDKGRPYSEDFGTVHQGIEQKKQAYADRLALVGKTGTNKNGRTYVKGAATRSAFINGMRKFQDEFHQKVAVHFQLARIGPRMQRLSYAENKRRKAEKQAEADLLNARHIKEQAEAEMVRIAKMAWTAESRAWAVAETIDAATADASRIVEDGKEEAQRIADQIRRDAEAASAELKCTILKMIAGDEKIGMKILQRKLELEEAKVAHEAKIGVQDKQLDDFESVIKKLAGDLESAKNWVHEMVRYLERNNDFTFSHVVKPSELLCPSDPVRVKPH